MVSIYDEKRIQLAHNTCIRFITSANKFERITPQLDEMEMLNIEESS